MKNGRISVSTAAKVLRMDAQTVRLLLRQGEVSWGKAFKVSGSKQYRYLHSICTFCTFTEKAYKFNVFRLYGFL